MELSNIIELPCQKIRVEEVILSMQRGFLEDVKPTWDKWEREIEHKESRDKTTTYFSYRVKEQK